MKKIITFGIDLNADYKKRLESIYLSMNKNQQSNQIVAFITIPNKLPRIKPSQNQIEKWKDSKIYGVWIDNKRINNSLLEKQNSNYFAFYSVSKLEKNALNYGKHFYQVNLLTTEYYNNYINTTVKTTKKYMIVTRFHKI